MQERQEQECVGAPLSHAESTRFKQQPQRLHQLLVKLQKQKQGNHMIPAVIAKQSTHAMPQGLHKSLKET
jgi:hypothetical protein